MYPTHITLSRSLFSLLIVCLAREVQSIKCYICGSDDYAECYRNPRKAQLFECFKNDFKFPNLKMTSSHFSTNLSTLFLPAVSKDSAEDYTDCITLEGTSIGFNIVLRGCAEEKKSCQYYIDMALDRFSFETSKCDRCNTDGCNSSTGLTAGLWSIISFFITLIYLKI